MGSKRNRSIRRQQARENPIASAGTRGEQGSGMSARATQAIIWGSAFVSVLPLLFYWSHFKELFFFHDDFLLLDELSRTTLIRWIFHPFLNESIFPLFKSLWIAAVWSSGGSYMALIALQWVTHFAICLAFGWLLIRMRLPAVAAGFAILTFG